MKIVSIDGVSLSYPASRSLFSRRKKAVIQDLNLNIVSGENVGIIGRNGVGKTSLLKMIAGILKPDAGTIWRKPELRSTFIGVNSGFVPFMTGKENIYLTGLLLGMNEQRVGDKLTEIIDYADIGNAINDQVASYSSGMQSRLAFSISLHSDPDLLLIDEALGVGDRDFRKKSSESLRTMIREDTTAIIVSHEVEFLKRVCNQVVWIEDGHVVRQGAPSAVLEEYDMAAA
ncbi:MAG: ABC transporter ATP-binding protein [Pseudomonadota bacterium]